MPASSRWTPVLLGAALASCSAQTSTYAPEAADGGASLPDTAPAADAAGQADGNEQGTAWRFVLVGDTHVRTTGDSAFSGMVPSILQEAPALVLVPGDIVEAGKACSQAQLRAQLEAFQVVTQPLRAQGIGVYPVRGNHEADAQDSVLAWRQVFSGDAALPDNGPEGEADLTYSFEYANALFVGLDDYVTIHQVNQSWLDVQLAASAKPHVFVFGHEPAFKVFHTDCLDDAPAARNAFWQSLSGAGARLYLCGHDHFFDTARIDDQDGDDANDLYQVLVGTGGGPFPPAPGTYNGDNSPYVPVRAEHEVQYGYVIVQISGSGPDDRTVTVTRKHLVQADGGGDSYAATGEVLAYTSTRP